MGEVYRATDTKLGRDVALKVLPAEMAQDEERLGRFRREAKALAQLDHPNIVTIYSVEESEGVHFLTMQLVDGQPLDRLINENGLPLERIVEIGSVLAEALAAAHEKGIVHRDLKPANVMVSHDGRVKVLDFGLAKDIRAATLNDATLTSDSRTQVGVVMGTPAYMSPEQTSGRPLDHRTDIFSLGVMLHELATGRRPFQGNSSAELASAILRDTPLQVTDLRSDLPADLARIIRRCLEKDPRYRMQTARDVSNEFRDLARHSASRSPSASGLPRSPASPDSGASLSEEAFRVAVLPFKYKGVEAGLEALAEGITEEIITGLSRFSYLRVVARTASARFVNEAVDAGSAAKELGARYVMEGSIRQAGTRLRIAVQLVDASSASHLWAETYERNFTPETIFDLQDDLAPRIVSTVADMNGVLPRSMGEAVRNKTPEQLSPYEAVLRSFSYFERVTAEELGAARSGLELAVRKAPTYADGWALLALLCVQDYVQAFRLQADSMTTGATAARRAIECGPSNHLAYFALAQVIFFQKEFESFRNAAERAVSLNPMDGNTLAFMGELLTYAGYEQRGMELAGRAKQLNPNHPGWYWYADFYNAYRQGDDRKALSCALKVNLHAHYGAHMMIAAAYGQLGDSQAAAKAVRELLKLRPDVPTVVRSNAANWWNPEYCERLIEGLRKAGMEIPEEGGTRSQREVGYRSSAAKAATGSVRTSSAASRTDEGFWVAVLPFKYTGGNADLKALAEGLSEEVITGLSRFSYLRVIARGSTAKYSSESGDVRAVGQELGARYVMEASLRQAGGKLRLAVQLADTVSGAHLWAETYERAFNPEALFELQDDLVPGIVSTVADMYGVLPRSMSEALRGRSEDSLTPHEAVLRSFSFFVRVTPEEHAEVRRILERTVEQAPDQADCWAMLAMICNVEYADEFNARPDSLDRASAAARRAVALAPTHALGHYALAFVHFFRKEFLPFRAAVERAVALNPMDGSVLGMLGVIVDHAGDEERGREMVETAMRLNPNHPGIFRFVAFNRAYRHGQYAEALEIAVRINLPGFFHYYSSLAAAHAQLGHHEAAQKALQDLLVLRPNFAAEARRDYLKWWNPEVTEHMIDGLRKAGLGIPAEKAAFPAATLSQTTRTLDSGSARADEGFWVAVLPFRYVGTSPDLAALAEGLTDDIVTNMSKFSYLRVIARSSTARYAQQAVDVRTAAKELGARYVMEGSIRQAGAKVRMASQLVDASTGAGLWAETYDRPFTSDTMLDLLDDVVPRIVATVGDAQGVLAHSMTESLRHRDPESLTPYEALLRSFGFHQHVNAEEHKAGITALEGAVKKSPDRADCWAMLSWLYRAEYTHGYNLRPDPMDRALAAAQRAVTLAPSSQLAQASLASAFFFRRELGAFRNAAERALSLNQMQGYTTAFLGLHFAYSGDWERGCALCEHSTQLNPNHPGWYWLPMALDAYRRHEGEGALACALKINMPGLWTAQVALAIIHTQLGHNEEARIAVRGLLAVRPDFGTIARRELEKWWLPEMVEQMLGDLGKAGLKIDGQQPIASGSISVAPSIAVLPFANMSDDKEQDYFSDGLAEEIINLLAQVPGLKVIARTSAFAFRGKEQDIRKIAEILGVSAVLEGSVRRSGNRIRVTAELINAGDGSHLWSERYDRELSDIFAVQDEISAAIAKALRVKLSPDAAPQRHMPELPAYEAYLKARHQQAKVTPDSMELARRFYGQASELDPAFAMPHIGLGFYWFNLAHFGRHSADECVPAARAEVQRALEIDPTLPEAHAFLGYLAAMYDMDWSASDKHFDVPMAKEVGFGLIRPLYGWVQFWRGNVGQAIELAQRAIEEDPLEVWARMNLHAYLQTAGRIDEALEQLKKVLELDENQVVAMVSMAMIYADKDDMAEALQMARRTYAIGPWFADGIGVLAGLTRRSGGEVDASLAKALGSGGAIGDARAHALYHLLCGEIEQGADWAEKAVEQHDSSMMLYLRFVVSKGLRSSHRWPKIAKMMNLPIEALAQPSLLS
jgi:TolB-like protein/Tfp pilus assembly protein PilF